MGEGPFADWDETTPVEGNEHIDSLGHDLLGQWQEEDNSVGQVGTNYEGMDEQRRVAAMNIAQHVAHADVRSLIADSALVDEYLKTGQLPAE